MKNLILLLSFTLASISSFAKWPIKFENSLGAGSFTYIQSAGRVDVGPEWKGFDLPRNNGTGFQLFTNNGVKAFDRIHAGIGLGYANYEGTSGALITANLAVDILKTKLRPFVYANTGYSHFWNQYSGGKGSDVFELGIGSRYKLPGKHSVFISAGNQIMHMNFYMTVKAGFTF